MSITVEQFKTYFDRDFPYLPVWDALVSYNTNELVYYETNRLFYKALSDSIPIGTLPTNTIYWIQTTGDIYDYISDSDIEKAIAECDSLLPLARFENAVLATAQLYLSAHCLCDIINTSNSGLASKISFPVSSKSAGSLSTSYSVPSNFLEREIYAFFLNSQYGLKYLTLLIPRSRGYVGVAYGATTP